MKGDVSRLHSAVDLLERGVLRFFYLDQWRALVYCQPTPLLPGTEFPRETLGWTFERCCDAWSPHCYKLCTVGSGYMMCILYLGRKWFCVIDVRLDQSAQIIKVHSRDGAGRI